MLLINWFSKVYLQLKAQAYLLVFIIIIVSSAKAQRCETYNYTQKNNATPSFQNTVSEKITQVPQLSTKDEVITVPVVIHILYHEGAENISDAQVMSQLISLNNDYRKLNADTAKVPVAFAPFAADAKIVFCIAKTDPNGRSTTGIIRKYTKEPRFLADDEMKFSATGGDNAWDCKKYLNIWVCNLFGRTLGYSSLPGSQADKDGIVIQYTSFGTVGVVNYPFNKGRTLTHEIGHWLGLQHVWGDKSCGDDGIADTPPQQSYNNGCPSFPHLSACSINSNGDMFMNFMDLTDDACMYMFTKGQAAKMRSMFAAGGQRNSFLKSTACDTSLIQGGPLPLEEIISKPRILLYPNPAVETIYLESQTAADIIGKTIRIYNVFGIEVITQVMTAQKNIIYIERLQKGIYMLKIGDRKDGKTMKFVKE